MGPAYLAIIYDWKIDAVCAALKVDIGTYAFIWSSVLLSVLLLFMNNRGVIMGRQDSASFAAAWCTSGIGSQIKCIFVRGTNTVVVLFTGTPLAHFYRLTEKSLIILFIYIILILRLD